MGLLSGLFKSRDKPENRTAGSSYAFYLGGSSSGKAVNERTAMQMTAVYACVRILSEAIAELPQYEVLGNGICLHFKALQSALIDQAKVPILVALWH